MDKEENANILAQRYGSFILKPSLFFPQRWPYYKQLHSLWWFFNSHFYKKVCTNWWLFILSFSVVIQEYIISQKNEIVKMFPPHFPQALFFNSHILDEKRICFLFWRSNRNRTCHYNYYNPYFALKMFSTFSYSFELSIS